MSGKKLLAIGGIWLVAAAISVVTRYQFAIVGVHVSGRGTVSRMAGIALLYTVIAIDGLFLIGWVVPVGLGTLRRLRGRRGDILL